MKPNRFLFFPSEAPSPSPSPSPRPLTSPNENLLEQLKAWAGAAFTTTTTLQPDTIFSFLETQVTLVVGATKAGTIATLGLVGALFFLSLFFFPGPTLIFLRWLALTCFYVCLFLIGLLYVTCRWIFIALVATCRWLFYHSHSVLFGFRDHYRPLLPERVGTWRRSYIVPENRSSHPVPPENRAEYGTYTHPENRGGSKRNSGNDDRSDICTDRQKMKETYEYRRAMEAEWAARHRELQRQAEEARRQRSKRAENKSAKANERRQKQRTDQQNSETSHRRKDDTNLNQREKYREEIRKKLSKLEKCVDMSSLLRSLGVHIPPQPSPNQLRTAYRQACLKFHPDRLATADLRHRIEAEEKFKLISAMKDKLSSL